MTKANSDESIMIILHQLMHLSEYQAMRGLEQMDLKPGQAGILFWLGREGELSQRRLAEKLGITPPSVTTALRKLEAKGLIGKEGDPADQRIQRIHLTEAGKEMLGELKRIVGEMEQVIFRGISQEEKLLLRRLLLDMRENLMTEKGMKGMNTCSMMARARLDMKLKNIESDNSTEI